MDGGNARNLSSLLNILERSPKAVMQVATWEERLGGSLVAFLRQNGLLVERGQAEWYPCGGPCNGGCARRIVRQLDSGTIPLTAACDQEEEHCAPIDVVEAELQLLGIATDVLVHRLRLAFGLSGVVEESDAGFPETRRIGELYGRRVFLALSPGIPGFEAWLGARRSAFVLVPVGRWLSTVTRDHFGPGQSTELVTLTEVLDVRDGKLVVNWPRQDDREETDDCESGLMLREPTVCVVYDNEGRRELTARQYRELIAGAKGYDLFVDMTDVTKGGGYRGSKRELDGRHEEVVLSRNEAAVIVELASAGRALRLGEFRSVTANHVTKIVEHARRKIDVALGRYEWCAIQTLKGSVPEAKAFQFRPKAEIRWGVVSEKALDQLLHWPQAKNGIGTGSRANAQPTRRS